MKGGAWTEDDDERVRSAEFQQPVKRMVYYGASRKGDYICLRDKLPGAMRGIIISAGTEFDHPQVAGGLFQPGDEGKVSHKRHVFVTPMFCQDLGCIDFNSPAFVDIEERIDCRYTDTGFQRIFGAGEPASSRALFSCR